MDHGDLFAVEDLEQNPQWAELICETFVRIQRGYYPQEDVAVITDRWPNILTFGDVNCFIQVHAMLCMGQALLTPIEIGTTPRGDRFVDDNDRALKENLPPPFEGRFWGGRGDEDGNLRWTEPIGAGVSLYSGGEKRQWIPPGLAPLEVGHTTGYTTLWHLNHRGCVARWP